MRGVANTQLTPELAFAVGRAGAHALAESSQRHRPVIVGRDTRLSGTMLEAAICAGITSIGRDVALAGVVPTPAVAAITVRTGAAAGVMISASHNPIADNGIKFFGPDGFKLSDELEDRIEALLDDPRLPRPVGAEIGVCTIAQNLGKHYYDELSEDAADLHGLTIVLDAAFGAAYAYAPYALRKLGADVVDLHCENDGARINVQCGATDLRPLVARVRELSNDGKRAIGVAFDGDADRALFVDETGNPLSGDHVLLILATDLKERQALPGDTVVATVMSNFGLERALQSHGIALLRAPVGDRYVLERMREGGYALGGEQSGHVIDRRFNTTGDGPRTAITLFSILASSGKTLHELGEELVVSPQVLLNVQTSHVQVLEQAPVLEAIEKARRNLTGNGRVLIRPSGTEPLIRVMVEGDDRGTIEAVANDLADRIRSAAARM